MSPLPRNGPAQDPPVIAEPDEFSFLAENAAEVGRELPTDLCIRRVAVDLGDGQHISAIRWGIDSPELVLLHGGAQNAHTWDSVALVLQRPAIAIDLPCHGHSQGEHFDRLDIPAQARAVAVAIERLAPDASAVVGMSLGGLVALAISMTRPDLVERLVLVDILPSSSNHRAERMASFLDGRSSFASFQEMLDWSVLHNPGRTADELRRGVLHNGRRRRDGRWVWRHVRKVPDVERIEEPNFRSAAAELWTAIDTVRQPLMLVRGATPASVLRDEHVTMLRLRRPDARVEKVEGAGHSVQRARPVELAELISSFLSTSNSNIARF